MADRRLVATSITDSAQVAQLVRRCGPWAALLFTWAIPHIDDDSRLEGSPDTLRVKLLGRYQDLVGVDEVAEMLATMNDLDLIVWYEVIEAPGERYLYFPRFTIHQQLRVDRYGPSRLPAPPNWKPEEGHPYRKAEKEGGKDLRRDKPQRDTRATRRVPKRPKVEQGRIWSGVSGFASAPAQPERAHGADEVTTAGSHIAQRYAAEDAPRPAAPRLDTTRPDTAEPRVGALLSEERSVIAQETGPETIAMRRMREELERQKAQAEERDAGGFEELIAKLAEDAKRVVRHVRAATGAPTSVLAPLGGLELVRSPNGELLINAPSAFAAELIQRHYVERLQVAAREALGWDATTVRVVVRSMGTSAEPPILEPEASA